MVEQDERALLSGAGEVGKNVARFLPMSRISQGMPSWSKTFLKKSAARRSLPGEFVSTRMYSWRRAVASFASASKSGACQGRRRYGGRAREPRNDGERWQRVA